MSLTISLRVPDGLVVAADSLASTGGQIQIEAHGKMKCPNCQKEISLDKVKLPPIPAPMSTKSYAQKLFPLFGSRYAVAAYGTGILAGKTVYYHAMEFEKEFIEGGVKVRGVTEAAGILGKRYAEILGKAAGNLEKIPSNAVVVGFQVVGYDQDKVGKTILVKIGRQVTTESYDKPGCTFGGDGQVVQKIWELGSAARPPVRPVIYEIFSLQDAIDYAEFLIDTTAKYQRFTNTIPSVGGEVDIALVTIYGGFQWIQRKKIQRILEGQES